MTFFVHTPTAFSSIGDIYLAAGGAHIALLTRFAFIGMALFVHTPIAFSSIGDIFLAAGGTNIALLTRFAFVCW